jgi:hypothetical protein
MTRIKITDSFNVTPIVIYRVTLNTMQLHIIDLNLAFGKFKKH